MTTPICGENPVLPSRIVGCGRPIADWNSVYRCTHCDVPFHKECAEMHFAGRVFTQADIDSMTNEEAAIAAKAMGHEG